MGTTQWYILIVASIYDAKADVAGGGCTNVSYYKPTEYIETGEECCSSKTEIKCEIKPKEICLDLKELKCEVVPVHDCKQKPCSVDETEIKTEVETYEPWECELKDK